MNRLAPGSTALAAAAAALAEIFVRGCTAEEALERVAPAAPDRAASRAILAGTLRAFPRIITAVDPRIVSGGREPQPWLRALLVCAVHQLEYSRAAEFSVVNIAVDAARALREPRAAGLVNAVLRRFLREREIWRRQVARDPAAGSAHPRWLYDTLAHAWPEQFEQVLAANNEAPPMTLRVDLTRGTRGERIAALSAAGIEAVPGWLESALMLREPRAVADLPGFAEGLVSVQDAGAQLAALLLAPCDGERVLDACAAPGGKTGHLLECAPRAEVVALDVDSSRLERVRRNLERQGRSATLQVTDLRSTGWWDGRPFDAVLVDAPCSGTGVIRRHPDIKLLRRPADAESFARTQLELLRAALRVVKPGGRLLYSTCSVLPEEGEGVVAALMAAEPRLALVPVSPPALPAGDVQGNHVLQILPTPVANGLGNVTDGFQYACLHVRDGRER
jgi:16S rRNA (cytosine967-C5)-methyltransferase